MSTRVRLVLFAGFTLWASSCRPARGIGDAQFNELASGAGPGFRACGQKADRASAKAAYRIESHVGADGAVSAASVRPSDSLGECLRAAVLALRISHATGAEDDVIFVVRFEPDADAAVHMSYGLFKTRTTEELAEGCEKAAPYGDGSAIPDPRASLKVILRNEVGGDFRFKTLCVSLDGQSLLTGAVRTNASAGLASQKPVTWRGPVIVGDHVLAMKFTFVGESASLSGYRFELISSRVVLKETKSLEIVLFEQANAKTEERVARFPAVRISEDSEDAKSAK